MLARVPVIAIAQSGTADFVDDDVAATIPYRMVPAESHLSVEGGEWAEPDLESLAKEMRVAWERRGESQPTELIEAAHDRIATAFSWTAVAERWLHLIDRARDRGLRPERRTRLDVELSLRDRGVQPATHRERRPASGHSRLCRSRCHDLRLAGRRGCRAQLEEPMGARSLGADGHTCSRATPTWSTSSSTSASSRCRTLPASWPTSIEATAPLSSRCTPRTNP